MRIMPGMQAVLKKFQLSPIDLERLLQQRKDPSVDRLKVELPRDTSLKAAVARMTKEAKAEDRTNLVMTTVQWKKLVLSHMTGALGPRYPNSILCFKLNSLIFFRLIYDFI